MKTSSSEKYIQQIFQDRFGIALSKIDEHDGRDERTSDFEYVMEGRRIFVCELKEIRNVLLAEKPGRTVINHPNGIVETFRRDNTIDRIGRHIYKAFKQLSKYPEPKVLLFLSHTTSIDVTDFEETLRGFRTMAVENDTQYINIYTRRVAEGDIKEIKKEIDLYIWIDSTKLQSTSDDKIFLRTITENGRMIARKYFGKLIAVA